MARGRWVVAAEDDAAEMYLQAMGALDRAGYEQYEISNVARPGRESRHNVKYWTDGEWCGFGCGAHSTRKGVREKNVASTSEYISLVSAGGHLAVERRPLTGADTARRSAVHGPASDEGYRLDRPGIALSDRCVASGTAPNCNRS
jgi:oxygen-independent coproporphyrinogen-3 oxidase